MRASGPVRTRQWLSIGAATLALAACGGGNSSFGGSPGGSSSGGGSSVLAGTFTDQTGSSERAVNGSTTDPVFGAVDGQGNAFVADMSAASAGNQAVFRLSPASQPGMGTVSGSYDAYFTGGSNNSIILNGSLTGTYTASGASLTFGPASGGSSNGGTATLVLDKPALTQVSFPTMAGTYTAQAGTIGGNGSLAISTSTNQGDTYTVTVNSSGNLTINDTVGCNFTSTSVTPVSSLDVYDLQASGTCPSTTGGTVNQITLTGLAVYLPKGAVSPVPSAAKIQLSSPALLLEMDDSQINSGSPKNAFALVAVQ